MYQVAMTVLMVEQQTILMEIMRIAEESESMIFIRDGILTLGKLN
jgi:hypothetical protein